MNIRKNPLEIEKKHSTTANPQLETFTVQIGNITSQISFSISAPSFFGKIFLTVRNLLGSYSLYIDDKTTSLFLEKLQKNEIQDILLWLKEMGPRASHVAEIMQGMANQVTIDE